MRIVVPPSSGKHASDSWFWSLVIIRNQAQSQGNYRSEGVSALYFQCVNVGSHQIAERIINHSVPLQAVLALKIRRHDNDGKVPSAVSRTGVSCM